MRLLNLVEKDHGVRLAAHGLGELAALVVADVARRRADQPRDAVLLHVFGHVDAHQRAFGVEQRLGERLRQFGFAHTRGAQKQKTSDRTPRVFDAAARAQNRLGHQRHGLVLADHALMQYVFEAEKLVFLSLDQTRDGHAAPLGDDLGDLFLGNFFFEQCGLLTAFLLQLLQLLFHLREFAVAELGHLVEVVTALGFVHLDAGRIDFLAQFSGFLDRGFFFFPVEFDALGFLTRLGEFGAKSVEPALAGVVFLLRERRLLDFQA